MAENIFYDQLRLEKKRKIRELMLRIIQIRKEQIETIERAFIHPLKNNINSIQRALKSEIPLKHYISDSLNINKYLKKLLNQEKNGK